MLVFMKQPYVELVRAGRKTSTIRPWAHCRVRVGGPISFNGRLRVTCTGIERTRIADLSSLDIRADGFESRDDFETAFRGIYPHATPDTPVWVIRFALNDSAQRARA